MLNGKVALWKQLPSMGNGMDYKKKRKIVDFLFSYLKISIGMFFPSCSCVKVLAYFLKILYC